MFWSTPSPAAGPSSPPRSRTPSSCSPAARASSCHDDPDALAAALRRVLTEPRWPAPWPPRPGAWRRTWRWPVVAAALRRAGDAAPRPRRAVADWSLSRDALPDRRTSTHRCDDRPSRHLRARRHAEPRPEHGYCTDDMARVLVVASREPEPAPGVQRARRAAPCGSWRTRRARPAPPQPDRRRALDGRRRPRGLLGPEHLGARHRRAHSDAWLRQYAARPVRAALPAAITAGPGPWPSRRWAPPRCSPSNPGTGRRALARSTTPHCDRPDPLRTRRGRGPSRDSPTRTRCSPRR